MEWLEYQPLFFGWRQNAGMSVREYKGNRHVFRASSMPGISDIIGSWGGKPLAIEVKRPGEKPRPNQVEFLRRASESGWITIVATSLDDVILALKSV